MRRNRSPKNADGTMDVLLFKTLGLYQLLLPSHVEFGKRYRTALLAFVWLAIGLQTMQIAGLFFALNDFQRFAKMAMQAINGLLCLYKGYTLVTNADRLWSTLDVTRYGFLESYDRRHGYPPNVLLECRATLTLLLRMFATLSYLTLVIWIVEPFFSANVYMPITQRDGTVHDYRMTINNLWMPVSQSVYNSPLVWVLIYLINAFMLIINAFCWIMFDCYIVTMCFTLNAQFHAMSDIYETLGRRGLTSSHNSSGTSCRRLYSYINLYSRFAEICIIFQYSYIHSYNR